MEEVEGEIWRKWRGRYGGNEGGGRGGGYGGSGGGDMEEMKGEEGEGDMEEVEGEIWRKWRGEMKGEEGEGDMEEVEGEVWSKWEGERYGREVEVERYGGSGGGDMAWRMCWVLVSLRKMPMAVVLLGSSTLSVQYTPYCY